MVEGGGLENRCTGNRTVGSNPTSSASLRRTLAALAAPAGKPASHTSDTRRMSSAASEGCPDRLSAAQVLIQAIMNTSSRSRGHI